MPGKVNLAPRQCVGCKRNFIRREDEAPDKFRLRKYCGAVCRYKRDKSGDKKQIRESTFIAPDAGTCPECGEPIPPQKAPSEKPRRTCGRAECVRVKRRNAMQRFFRSRAGTYTPVAGIAGRTGFGKRKG